MHHEWENEPCPCLSGKMFKNCCNPYFEKTATPPTAEALMRSRYTAFVVEEVDYIYETHDPATRGDVDIEEIRAWAEQSDWEGLSVVSKEAGGENDDSGKVEFVAHYTLHGKDHHHHESSIFTRKEGKWYFTEGTIVNNTVRRDGPKIGRNDPCVCGSGKKFKKCCGR